jgi:hypothetical protein
VVGAVRARGSSPRTRPLSSWLRSRSSELRDDQVERNGWTCAPAHTHYRDSQGQSPRGAASSRASGRRSRRGDSAYGAGRGPRPADDGGLTEWRWRATPTSSIPPSYPPPADGAEGARRGIPLTPASA